MGILEAIEETIKYSQKYGGNLSEEELFERLIDKNIYTKSELKETGVIIKNKKNPYLKGKIVKAEKLSKQIGMSFKDVLFMGITGSVAAGSPKKDSDIDLMIITRANTLWLNRLKLRWLVVKNKIPHRKPGVREKMDEFCFNLWLDEKTLKLKKERQNLKNAMDLIMMRPLINKNRTYEKFILVNGWAKNFVATGYKIKISKLNCQMINDKKSNYLDVLINYLVFWPQFLYMKKKMKGEQVSLHEAFFHR